jgi:hypothetical protein
LVVPISWPQPQTIKVVTPDPLALVRPYKAASVAIMEVPSEVLMSMRRLVRFCLTAQHAK